MTPPPPESPIDGAPALTPDLVYKRDVQRRRLGTELGDRTFREWLERSLAAVAAEEEPVAEAASAPNGMRDVHDAADDSPPGDAGAGAIAAEPEPVTVDCAPEPCAGSGPRIAPTTQRARVTRNWSEADLRTLRERYAAGDHYADIAEGLGRSPNSVLGKIHRLHLRQDGERRRPRQRPASAAKKTGRWSVEEINTLCRMADEGASPQGIADRLGRSRHGVISVAGRCGVHIQRLPGDAGDGRDGTASAGPAGEEPAALSSSDAAGSTPAPRSDHYEAPEPQPAPLTGCLWPEGEPPELTFCGTERSPGRSYCPEHCVRALVKPNGRPWPIARFYSPPPQGKWRRRASA